MIERLRRWLRRATAGRPYRLGRRHALWVAHMMSAEDGGARRPASLLAGCARLDFVGTAPEEWEVKLGCQN